MTQWDETIAKHDVAKSLDHLGSQVEQLRGLNLVAVENLDRLAAIHEYAVGKLAATEPYLVLVDQLDSLDAAVSACANDLEEYRTSRDSDYWESALTRGDPIVRTASQIPAMQSIADIELAHRRIVRFRRSAGQLIARLQKSVKLAEESVTELKAQVGSQKEEVAQFGRSISTLEEELRTQIAEEKEQRDSEAATAMEQARGQLDTALEEAKEAFDALLEERSDELNTQAAAEKESFAKLKTHLERDLRTTVSNCQQASQDATTELERLIESARESVGIIASTGMAGGYEKTAIEEKKVADLWRKVATGAFSGIIIIALMLAFWPTLTDQPMSWELFASKAYASLAFALLAAYAGREAEKHRQSERSNRQRSLELRSLNPFLEPLDRDQQAAVRTVVADRIFGREMHVGPDVDAAPPVSPLIEALRMLKGPGGPT